LVNITIVDHDNALLAKQLSGKEGRLSDARLEMFHGLPELMSMLFEVPQRA
jgi:hypothetical protein